MSLIMNISCDSSLKFPSYLPNTGKNVEKIKSYEVVKKLL